jgi:hypothetical protein
MDASPIEQLVNAIESVGSDLQWKMMPLQVFESKYVSVVNSLDETSLAQVMAAISERSFLSWTKKLWTEQDMLPNDEYDAYERSKPIMIALKRSLLLRMSIEEDRSKRTALQQQLALISLILDPAMVAKKTGLPLSDQS